MTNESVLAAMTRSAARRLQHGAFTLLDNDGYVRVSGSGFRAVCVSDASPLCEFGGSVKRIDSALRHMNRERPASKAAQNKEERCVQAHIIRSALSHRLDLIPLLGTELPFDQLLFALDEVRLTRSDRFGGGIIRCDLLAVAVRGEVCEPAIIELKWGRQLAQLRRQLDEFSDLFHSHRESLERLLGAAVGRPGVNASRVHQVIVWPKAAQAAREATERTRRKLAVANVSAVSFVRDHGHLTFEVEVAAASAAWHPRACSSGTA